MNKFARTKVTIIVLTVSLGTAHYGFAQSDSYSQLVTKAQADLNAGNAAQALTESQKAIGMARTRWEAYVVAGGALQLEHRYDQATTNYSLAVQYAPDAKKSAVRALLQKAIAAQDNTQSPSSSTPQLPSSTGGPSYSDTVAWITANIVKAGFPEENRQSGGPDYTEQARHQMSFMVNGCATFMIVDGDQTIVRDQGPGSSSTEQYGVTTTWTFDISHVAFSEASATNSELGIMALDGVGRWHYHNVDSNGGVVDDQSQNLSTSTINMDHFRESGGAQFLGPSGSGIVLGIGLYFKIPGTEDIPPHLVNAFQHLQQICKEHPEQAQKQPF